MRTWYWQKHDITHLHTQNILNGFKVLYVSAEESTSQSRLLVARLDVLDDNLYILAEIDLGVVFNKIE